MVLIKCMYFLLLCNIGVFSHKSKLLKPKSVLLLDDDFDDYGKGHNKWFGGLGKLGGHHGGLKGHGHGHGHGHGGLGGFGGHEVLKIHGGYGGESSCGGSKTALVEIVESRKPHGELIEIIESKKSHGGLVDIIESKKSLGASVGVKPPVIIVEEEAANCGGAIIEAAPVTVHQEAATPKIIGESKPVRLVHHAEPFLIQSYEKPLIIDHYKKAVVANHNPEPVILDHMVEPSVAINQGSSGGFGGAIGSSGGFGGAIVSSGFSSGYGGQTGGYAVIAQPCEQVQPQYVIQSSGCQKCC